MRVLVTGAAGMLGKAVSNLLSRDHEVIGVDVNDFDLSTATCIPKIAGIGPETVCHLAAFTDVDRCELDPMRAYESNVVGTRNVSVACEEVGCPMLYVSTDYVFDGKATQPYDIDARSRPLNMYGRTKLIGEWFVERNVSSRYIVRSSWLFGEGGANFVETIITLSETESDLGIVDDQRGSPTYARDLAFAIRKLIEQRAFGKYHVTNSGACTWYELAIAVLNMAGIEGCTIRRTSSSQLDRPAKRPAFSVLDNRAYVRATGEPLRRWEEALAEYFDRRNGGKSNG